MAITCTDCQANHMTALMYWLLDLQHYTHEFKVHELDLSQSDTDSKYYGPLTHKLVSGGLHPDVFASEGPIECCYIDLLGRCRQKVFPCVVQRYSKSGIDSVIHP